MTRRERMERSYFYRETDRPAVFVRTGFPSDDPTYDRLKAYLEEHTELKAPWYDLYRHLMEKDYPVESFDEPYSADFVRRVRVLRTPAGELRSSSLLSTRGQPGLHETYFINSPEDAEKYLSLPLPDTRCETGSFAALEAATGDRGIVDVLLGLNPGGFAATLCGSVNFALLSVSDREILHRLCRRRLEIMLNALKYLVSRGVGPFFSILGEEYIVPPLHGPADFHDFNTRYDKPIIDLAHEAGGRFHVHSHGSVKRVFDGFLEMGADVLHPFEPPPQGDILAREAKELARGRMCLEGNIQISRMYEADPGEIREETARLIADAFDDRRGLIVCPTASPYIRGAGEACFPRVRAMVEAVLDSALSGK